MVDWMVRVTSLASALALAACGAAREAPSATIDASADVGAVPEGGALYVYESGAPYVYDSGAPPAPDADLGSCAASVEQAHPLLLDLELVLDTSGSMDDLAAPGESKWSALVAALTAFVEDPGSNGLGVGVQYFPVPPAGIPATCTSNAECGAAGPCVVGQCDDFTALPCATSRDCLFGGACVATTVCAADPNFDCAPAGSACGADDNGFDLGACAPAGASYCASSDSCAPSDYAAPAVAIATLPAAAGPVVASLVAQQPHGGTPTPAALQGALAAAASYASAHPTHRVATILATDGIPDEAASSADGQCDSADPDPSNAELASLTAAAVAATPSIPTFAIGVFTPDEIDAGTASLTPIAAAGGSGRPFIVEARADPDAGPVEAQLVDAFNRIRAATLPCQFSIPSPEAGIPDFGRVNVRITPGGGAPSDLAYVASSSGCAGADGWYYDVGPASGGLPTTIVVCASSCTRLHGDPSARVDILLGCRTLVR